MKSKHVSWFVRHGKRLGCGVGLLALTLQIQTARATPGQDWLSITINKGDTLSSVFQRHGLSQGELMELIKAGNDLRSLHRLQPGQMLKIKRDEDNQIAGLRLSLRGGRELIADKILTDEHSQWNMAVAQADGDLEELPHKPGNIGSREKDYVLHNKTEPRTTQSGEDWLQANPRALKVLNQAKALLGSPYRYGGMTPRGFDCSGFVYYNMRKVGVKVPRTAHQQYLHTRSTPVARKNLRAGDLVFFRDRYNSKRIGHVGIYIGNDRFIHAVATNKPVAITRLSKSYYSKRFVRGGRLLG